MNELNEAVDNLLFAVANIVETGGRASADQLIDWRNKIVKPLQKWQQQMESRLLDEVKKRVTRAVNDAMPRSR